MIILPLEVSAGEDFYLPIQYQIAVCGTFYPVDITGFLFEMQIGVRPFNAEFPSIIDVSSASGQIIVDGPNGKAEIYIPNSITVNPYYFGCWQYAVKATNAQGLVQRIIGGPFNIKGWY